MHLKLHSRNLASFLNLASPRFAVTRAWGKGELKIRQWNNEADLLEAAEVEEAGDLAAEGLGHVAVAEDGAAVGDGGLPAVEGERVLAAGRHQQTRTLHRLVLPVLCRYSVDIIHGYLLYLQYLLIYPGHS